MGQPLTELCCWGIAYVRALLLGTQQLISPRLTGEDCVKFSCYFPAACSVCVSTGLAAGKLSIIFVQSSTCW